MENLCRRDVVKIDLNKGLSRSYAGMVLATGDKMANCFGAALYRGNEVVDITGYAVTGYFIRNSGSETVVIAGKAEGNEAVVELPQACYSSDGGFSLAIKVSGADVTATVRVVDGTIRLTQTGVTIDPGEVIPSLDELFAQIEAMEQATMDASGAAFNANKAAAQLTAKVNEKLRQIAPPIINTATGDGVVLVSDSSESTFERLSIFGRTTQIGTPSPENPVEMVNIGTKGNIGLIVRGKNLLKNTATTRTTNGITFTVDADGTITINGTATENTWFAINTDMGLQPGDYILSGNTGGELNKYFLYVSINGKNKECLNSEVGFTVADGDTNTAYFVVYAGVTLNNHKVYPMIRQASVKNVAYEPYKDGSSMTLIPPDEIFGIPVSGGGNYTDETGQQWLCDEIDLAKGVFAKNVPFINLAFLSYNATGTAGVFTTKLTHAAIPTGYTDDQTDVLMCNTLPPLPRSQCVAGVQGVSLSGPHMYVCVPGCTTPDELLAWFENNQTFAMYRPAEPINQETPLNDDIMSAAMALKSLYPNTTIINDEGAGMLAAYVADTKNYIDQRIAALLNA